MKRLVVLGIPSLLVALVLVGSRAAAGPRAVQTVSPTMKILVDKDGWYRVSMSSLQTAGFVPPSNLNLLHLSMNGQDVPFELRNGSLEFYGQGLDTLSSDTRTYWLSVGATEGLQMEFARARATASPAPTAGAYQATLVSRERKSYIASLLTHGNPGTQVGNNIFGDGFFQGFPTSRQLTLTNVDVTQQGTLKVDLYGLAGTSRIVTVKLNNTTLGTMNGFGVAPMSTTFNVPANTYLQGVNTIDLTDAGANDLVVTDAYTLKYQHPFLADNNVLDLPVTGGQAVSVGGFSSGNVRLLDISNPGSPKELFPTITQNGATFTINITAPQGATRLYAFADSAALSPKQVLSDDPSTLKSTSNKADLIVIAYKDASRDFIADVQPLVQLRQQEGLTVKVVNVQDVFDEFGNPLGTYGPDAITSFLQYAKNNWQAPAPKYVLLVGDATYDPRGFLNEGNNDFIPTLFFDATFSEAPSDDALADFNDDGRPELAVGRLPVRTDAEANLVVSKIVGYAASTQPKTALLVADNFDRGDYHFDQFSTDLKTTSLDPNSVISGVINRPSGTASDPAIHTQIMTAASNGPTIVNWFGHGSFAAWNANLLQRSDAPSITNTSLSLYLMMTCQNGFFVATTFNGLGEALLLAPHAAVAVWASTGDTVPGDQVTAAKLATAELFAPVPKRLGDAMLDAKNSPSVTDMDVLHTWTLLGDPTMKLNIPFP